MPAGTPLDQAQELIAAGAMRERADRLGADGRPEEQMQALDDLLERFGDSPHVEVQVKVAQALIGKALVLDGLGRHAEELPFYEEVLARFGASPEPPLWKPVAWALYDRGLTLAALERPDDALASYAEVVERFAGSDRRALRKRVSWSLAKAAGLLAELTRIDEALPLMKQLVARGDESLDPGLADHVAWCLEVQAARARAAGDEGEGRRVQATLVDRFGGSSDRRVLRRVADAIKALASNAPDVEMLGRYREVLARCDAVSSPAAVRSAGWARRSVAVRLEELGLLGEALAVYDEALSSLAGADDPKSRDVLVALLRTKGIVLNRANRHEEAVVVLDSAIATYRDLVREHGPRDAGALARALDAASTKIGALCTLGRTADAAAVPGDVADLLGAPGAPGERVPGTAPPSEASLAALLADVHRDEWWRAFGEDYHDESTRGRMEGRALELFRRTAPWLAPDVADPDGPVSAAVLLIRGAAAGYAIASGEWARPRRTGRQAASRELAEWAIRRSGIADWADELGVALGLGEESEDADDAVERLKPPADAKQEAALAPAVVDALRNLELIELACDTPTGRAALETPVFRVVACWRLWRAHRLAGWTGAHREDIVGAAQAIVFAAEAFYLATRGEYASSAAVVPGREEIGPFLRSSAAWGWLADEDVVLPEWVEESD